MPIVDRTGVARWSHVDTGAGKSWQVCGGSHTSLTPSGRPSFRTSGPWCRSSPRTWTPGCTRPWSRPPSWCGCRRSSCSWPSRCRADLANVVRSTAGENGEVGGGTAVPQLPQVPLPQAQFDQSRSRQGHLQRPAGCRRALRHFPDWHAPPGLGHANTDQRCVPTRRWPRSGGDACTSAAVRLRPSPRRR